MGGWWRWALVSPDGVAPSRMVGVSTLLALAYPGGPGKRVVKRLWWWCSTFIVIGECASDSVCLLTLRALQMFVLLFVVLSLFFHTKPRELGERLQNDPFCVEKDVKP